MATPLPTKFKLPVGVTAESLKGADKTAYDQRASEEARRMQLDDGAAQEALDLYDELESEGRSPSECFTQYGYSLRMLKAAIAERERIMRELAVKPSKDVTSAILDVKAVQAKHEIPEYVKPKPAEPKGEPKGEPTVIE